MFPVQTIPCRHMAFNVKSNWLKSPCKIEETHCTPSTRRCDFPLPGYRERLGTLYIYDNTWVANCSFIQTISYLADSFFVSHCTSTINRMHICRSMTLIDISFRCSRHPRQDHAAVGSIGQDWPEAPAARSREHRWAKERAQSSVPIQRTEGCEASARSPGDGWTTVAGTSPTLSLW